MAKLILGNGEKVIETPWMTAQEAARYCGVHVRTFYRLRGKYKLAGRKKYHHEDLDKMMASEHE